ncbi:MAG TPA: APC family permease, partial [Candidatus Norongarragalinales archaeon]|nr:APC family permease [Candidatus Norongarragalinales archaeon]
TGGKLEDFFTVGKIIPLLFLVALGAYFFRPERFVPDAMVAFPALFSTVILALWAYQGAEIITVPEEEIKHAKKTVPKAILVSILTVTVLYLLVAGAVLTLPWASFVQSQAPLADLVGSLVGPWGGFVLAIGGLLSILGALNAVILASSRISYAMSQDGLFPKYFSHLHEKHGTPDHALVMHAMAASVVVFVLQDFSQLATLVVFFTLVPYFFSSLSTYILQKKHPHPHSLLGKSALIPALAAVLSFGLALYAGFLSPFLSVGFLTFGIAAYVVFRRDAGSGKQAAFGSSHRFDAKNPGKNNRKKR